MASGRDASAIASVLRRSFADLEALYTPRAYAETISSPDGVLERLREGPIWVGVIDERVLATASAVVTSKGLYVRGMGVIPEARGRKFGWRLLERAERLAREERLARMYLSTTPFLDAAIHLYESYGFERTEEGPFELFGTPLFTMVKNFEPPAARDQESRNPGG